MRGGVKLLGEEGPGQRGIGLQVELRRARRGFDSGDGGQGFGVLVMGVDLGWSDDDVDNLVMYFRLVWSLPR